MNPTRLALLALVAMLAAPAQAASCKAVDSASLRACLAQADDIQIDADIQCSGAGCCSSGPRQDHLPLLTVIGASGKVIHGNGHTVRRRDPQQTGALRGCPALRIGRGTGVTVTDLAFDEDPAVAPCTPEDMQARRCAPTVQVMGGDGVTLDHLRVRGAKAVGIFVHGTRHLTLRDSEVADSGVFGVAISTGEKSKAPTEFLSMTGCKISGSRTNGLTVGGLSGTRDGDNRISGNTFEHNHWHGLWFSPGIPEASPGGQVYLAEARYLDFTGNTISNGYCENCARHNVVGLELGKPDVAGSIAHLRVTGNRISNHPENGISRNRGVVFDSSVRIEGNRISGSPGAVCFIRAAGGCDPDQASASRSQLTP